MPKKYQFSLPFDTDPNEYVRQHLKHQLPYRVVSKSLDARGAPRGKKPVFHYTILALVDENDSFSETESFTHLQPFEKKPLIIGAGPGGLFAAVRLAEYGIPSIILERGAKASERMLKIAKFWRHGELDSDTNVCYGEGGAGLFSDGKLITRVKSDYVSYVMKKFVEFGAPEETAFISNPHLGSNKIRGIITRISNWLIERGCEIHYEACVDEVLTRNEKVCGVRLRGGKTFFSDHIILATGHSASDIYQELQQKKIAMKAKDFAVGVRVEHTRQYIDFLQHGKFSTATQLGSARYRLSWHDKWTDHGVYSFCMCPGGYVLSSGTEKEGLVVNGMSNFARNSHWSNAALVVSVKVSKDIPGEDLMRGVKLQHEIEKKAFELSLLKATGRELPAMTMREFLTGKLTSDPLPKTSSPSGVFKADIRDLFPSFIVEHLTKGLQEFNKNLPGFITNDALLIAPETRTSSPITILRDKITLMSTSHQGLYPCGEGAGYAGGITSAAVDGVKCAMSIISNKLK